MITYQKDPYKDEEIYSVLHPYVSAWFRNTFKEFSAPQRYGIMPIHEKKNTLIFASTGSGKTLTAFTSIINELTFLSEAGELEDNVYCIYISPLKALSRDIKVNLKDPLSGIRSLAKKDKKKIDIRTAVRTGDTSQSRRSSMLKRPPHILITTPESFAILLTSPKFRQKLDDARWVIVDEIHALASSKRGTHLSLSLERLNQTADFVRIGLSATVAPLEEVARFLVGKKDEKEWRDCTIVDAQFEKKMDLKVLSPVENLITSSHEKVHRRMYEMINEMVQAHKTTLIFTNTRAATERVVHNLKDKFPKIYTEDAGKAGSKSLIGAHHGSLSAAHRLKIEDQLKNGELKCIVSSTSLELGIDIGYIDLVILLGSPKSVARALQRIGRSGHKLNDTAKGRIIVLDRDDLVECSVLLKAAIEKKIDKVDIPKDCLDVLSQQIYGMAIERKQTLEELYWTIKKSYSFQSLPREKFDSIISYLAGDYASLEDRKVYAKIWVDEETGMVGRRGKLARVIYMTNIGTIPDESFITVKIGEEVVGKLDENFLERLKPGDVFVLGGETYEFRYSRGMTAQVRTSSGRPPTVPSWFSEMLPLSFDLAVEIQKFRRFIAELFDAGASKEKIIGFINDYLYVDTYGANSIFEYFSEQHSFSEIPNDRKLLVEHFSEDERKYAVFHTLYGRRVNDVLSRAMAYAISVSQHRDVELTINDNGFMISYFKNINTMKALKQLANSDLRGVMEKALDKTEILRRRFRHCAARSLMILRSYRGKRKSVGKQQMSSQLLINAVRGISKDFPILSEARREVLNDLMDIGHAELVLRWLSKGDIIVVERHLDFPSPFSFNLIVQGYSDIFKIEDKKDFLIRMHKKVLERIKNGGNLSSKQQDDKMTFSYKKLWEKMQEERRVERMEKIEDLKYMAGKLEEPLTIKQELIKMIDGKSEIDKATIDYVNQNLERLKQEWPEDLFIFISKKAGYLDEKAVLMRQLNRANRKEKLDDAVLLDLKRLIDGERDGFSKDFREWLDSFLDGTIGYHWKDKIVNFLKDAKAEIQ